MLEKISWAIYGLGYVVAALVFLFIAKKLFDWLTPYSVNVQLTEKNNPTVGIVLMGYLLGIIAIICGNYIGQNPGTLTLMAFISDLGIVAIYALLGMFLLFFAGVINDKIVLRKFSNVKEIIENKNSAVAITMGATYIGSGLIITGGIRGSEDMISVLIAFILGQIALLLFAVIYQLVTGYDCFDEIGKNKNISAGLAFGGNIVAFSIILMQGFSTITWGLETWQEGLSVFAYYAVVGAVLLVLIRIVNDRIFLPSVKISHEIAHEQNLNAGLMEGGLALAMGAVLIFSL